MQSRPTELPKVFSPATLPESNQPSHHGDRHDDHSIATVASFEAEVGSATPDSQREGDSSASSQAREEHPVEGPNSDRLSNLVTPRNKSPVDRIIEHENSSTPSPRTRWRGPEFRIIPRTSKPASGSTKLSDFPNGKSPFGAYIGASLTISRGLDAHSLAPASVLAHYDCSGISTISCIGDNTPRMEDCFREIFLGIKACDKTRSDAASIRRRK